MHKSILFFQDDPPQDKKAIHVWLGKVAMSHDLLLHSLIQRYLGSSPFTLAKSAQGKPYLPDGSLHLSLSDSEEWVAVAFSFEAPVGIDIEMIRPLEEMEWIIRDSFSKREQALFHNKMTEAEKVDQFWQIWTRKEACAKTLGQGLLEDFQKWDCPDAGWSCVNGIWVRSIESGHGLATSVAIKNSH